MAIKPVGRGEGVGKGLYGLAIGEGIFFTVSLTNLDAVARLKRNQV